MSDLELQKLPHLRSIGLRPPPGPWAWGGPCAYGGEGIGCVRLCEYPDHHPGKDCRQLGITIPNPQPPIPGSHSQIIALFGTPPRAGHFGPRPASESLPPPGGRPDTQQFSLGAFGTRFFKPRPRGGAKLHTGNRQLELQGSINIGRNPTTRGNVLIAHSAFDRSAVIHAPPWTGPRVTMSREHYSRPTRREGPSRK